VCAGIFGVDGGSDAMVFNLCGRYNRDRYRRMVDQAKIHRKVASGDVGERKEGVEQLRSNFADLPDKDEAWKDLIWLAQSNSRWVVRCWHNIKYLLTWDKNIDVRRGASNALGYAFQHVPDKDEAWKDLIRLTGDKNGDEQWQEEYALGFFFHQGPAYTLGSAFQHVPDKDEAWKDLHRLTGDKNGDVRRGAANALGSAFQHVPNKDEAWKDLHRLTGDKNGDVRRGAANALGSAFQHVPYKDEAWKDLHRLTGDKNGDVRWGATNALGSAFLHVPDKDEAWKDLHRLTGDKNGDVRRGAANALGSVFQHSPDKDEAWKDLIRLTGDEDRDVRRGARDALGSVFQHVPDKDEAWKDLIRLTGDKNGDVRASANHLLGRVSIFRATGAESEEDFRKEMKNALEFFERSSKEEIYSNPSKFCLPFYRSFYTVTFEKEGAEDEVQRYLAEAKSASKGSKNKETLLEAVENLAKALSEAQKVTDFDATKSDLKTYMQYCNRAADLIGDAAEDAPGAAGILRRGMPIIDERIKEIIREIQEKARAVCIETQGTPLEELGLATDRFAQDLPTQDPLRLTKSLGSMANSAKVLCELIATDDERRNACELLKNLSELELPEQGRALDRALEYITTCLHNHRNETPTTKTIYISDTQKEIVRIAVAQFCFELTESFPFILKNKDEVKTKVFSVLEIAKHDGANILCLPELCLCEEWISEIEERYPDIIVIGGSFYKDKMNICPVIMKSNANRHYQPKITPSRNEDPEMTGEGMVSGDAVYIYETRFGRFMVLICRDFDHLLTRLVHRKNPDMIFCPAFNPASANRRFHNAAHPHVEKSPLYIMIANTGKYGGTSIFGRLHKDYFGQLVGNGCKDAGDLTYKLCEVKEGQEEVILADFNLIHKSVQIPTPSDPNEDTRSVGRLKKIPIQPDRSRI
jgi:HEAT repeat protein/predicted amidohydrolase